jgi:hypothetical protein
MGRQYRRVSNSASTQSVLLQACVERGQRWSGQAQTEGGLCRPDAVIAVT